jgi:cytochrome c
MRAILTILPAVVVLLAATLAAAEVTVWDGVYTTAQAARGKQYFESHCKLCHGADLGGGTDDDGQVPPLKKENFGMSRRDVNNLYGFMSENMPKDNPASLAETTYADLIAYVLQQNGFPDGKTELKPDADLLTAIKFVKKP